MDDDFSQLKNLLENSDPDTRGMAAVALGQIQDPQAVDVLIDLLEDKDTRVVCAAAQSLGAQGDGRAVPALIPLMQTDDVEVRCSVLSAFALIADERAFATVITAMFDIDDQVRRNATAAIGRLGDKRALEPLYEMLDDDFSWVRANAALSLHALADARAVPYLEKRLAVEDDDMVRGNLILALGECDAANVPRVIEFLIDDGESDKVRVSAAITLANLAEEERIADEAAARDALIALLLDSSRADEVRAGCAWSLGRFKPHASSVEALCSVLEDDFRWLVFYALESLALLGDTSVMERLERLREEHSDDSELVEHVDGTLQELGADLSETDIDEN